MIVNTPENIAWTDCSLQHKITEVEETTHDRKIDESNEADATQRIDLPCFMNATTKARQDSKNQ